MIYLQQATKKDLKAVKCLYKSAFPRLERKSLMLIKRKVREGLSQILAVKDEADNFCGLMITAVLEDIMLLDYFAVVEEVRGKSIGSQALNALLKSFGERYRIFLEIELPDGEDDLKNRRKNFYLRNGFKPSGIEVILCSVPMELLYHTKKVSFEEYHRLYREVFGDKLAQKVTFVKQSDNF